MQNCHRISGRRKKKRLSSNRRYVSGSFFSNEKPLLSDEWQDAPKIWGAVRKDCDDNLEKSGSYYLTGSTSRTIETPHTGTGRIFSITMYPMMLWKSKDSDGGIMLNRLFDKNTAQPAVKTFS